MIRAYPGETTVDGPALRLHVATDARRFRVRFYRQGATFEAMAGDSPRRDVVSVDAPMSGCGEPWMWPPYTFDVPTTWPSGAYVAQGVESEREPALESADARTGTALFVLRRPPGRRLMVNIPLFTYHAYNIADIDGTRGDDEGACLYSGYRSVNILRPGGGTGGHTWDARNPDVYDRTSPRQTFAHWDAKALAWLEANGYFVDVCTDLDLHRGRLDKDVALLLAFGHQEYWTPPMRRTVEHHLERGGNVAFFSANTAWFRIRYDEARGAIERDGRWSDDDPEERLTGLSYRFGGGFWLGERPPLGYTVHDPSHWVFAGTGLREGDVFGAAQRLIGYECDGRNPSSPGSPLASASLQPWRSRLERDGDEFAGDGDVMGDAAAMVAFRYGNGVVFNAGTVDWPRVLAAGEPSVERITHNVIDRLSRLDSSPAR